MSITVICDSCAKSINASEKYAGKRVKCPGCQSPLLIPSQEIDFSGPLVVPVVSDEINCPFCAEPIKSFATKCKHCGEFLDGRSKKETINASWSPGVAAVLSLILPGLGQIYKGQIVVGLLLPFAIAFADFLVFIMAAGFGSLLLLICIPILHFVVIYDAYNAQPKLSKASK